MNAHIDKLTPEFLLAMRPGVEFETEGLLGGLVPKENLHWKNTSLNHNAGQYMFSVSMMGVSLGQVAIFVRKDGRVEAERL